MYSSRYQRERLLNCLRTGEQYTVGDYDWVTRYRVHSKTETWGSKGGYLLRLEDGYIVSSYSIRV